MPFRPENRMVTFLVMMLFLTACLAAGMVYLLSHGASGMQSTPANLFIGGIIVLIVKDLIWLIHEYASRKEIKEELHCHNVEAQEARQTIQTNLIEVKETVKRMEEVTNGNLQKAIQATGEEVRKAEHNQLLEDPAFLKKVADIQSVERDRLLNDPNFMRRLADALPCDEIADKAAKAAVEELVRRDIIK
jgi:type III secretory pathway component EscR